MKKFKIKMHLSIGFQSSHNGEDFFEMPDDATPAEIEREAGMITDEWASNFIELGYAYQPEEEVENEQ